MNIAELKRQAVQYYTEHQIPGQIETLLNSLFFDKPPDLYGYMSNHFRKLANPPIITKIKLHESISPAGEETIRFVVYCRVNGEIKKCFSLEPLFTKRGHEEKPSLKTIPIKSTNKKESKSKINKKEQSAHDNAGEVPSTPTSKETQLAVFTSLVSIIQNDISPMIFNVNLDNQDNIDEMISNLLNDLSRKVDSESQNCLSEFSPLPENSTVQIITHPASVVSETNSESTSRKASLLSSNESEMLITQLPRVMFFVSMLASYARSICDSKRWYKQLSNQFYPDNKEDNTHLPLPAISFMSSDITSPGKLNMFKNVYLLPKLQSDWKESLSKLISLYHYMEEEMSAKQVVIKNSNGSLVLSFERPEQMFELLMNSCRSYFNDDLENLFDIILNISANEFYDEEKKKYEITMGNQKTGNELVSMYTHWLETYPIIGIIDAISSKDGSNMEVLCNEINNYCYIINTPCIDKGDDMARNNGVYFQCVEEKCSTISQLRDIINEMRGADVETKVLLMDDEWCSYQHLPLAVDLSIACKSDFLCCASPRSSWGSTSITRWLEIYSDAIEMDDKLSHRRQSYGFKTKKIENDEHSEELSINDAA